jgi:hypothetical protein
MPSKHDPLGTIIANACNRFAALQPKNFSVKLFGTFLWKLFFLELTVCVCVFCSAVVLEFCFLSLWFDFILLIDASLQFDTNTSHRPWAFEDTHIHTHT